MFGKPKYPLTDEAKDAARYLVKAWDDGLLGQIVQITVFQRNGEEKRVIFAVSDEFTVPSRENFLELSTFNLVKIDIDEIDRLDILLLQELRNAVENDFSVSDYFLTMNAIGIFNAGGNITNYGNLNAAASIGGAIEQHGDQVADELVKALGSLAVTNENLRASITALQESNESTFSQRLGNVVEELGRSLGHGANTAQVLQALAVLGRLTGQL